MLIYVLFMNKKQYIHYFVCFWIASQQHVSDCLPLNNGSSFYSSERKRNVRRKRMKRVAAGRSSPASLAFEPTKRPDDRTGFTWAAFVHDANIRYSLFYSWVDWDAPSSCDWESRPSLPSILSKLGHLAMPIISLACGKTTVGAREVPTRAQPLHDIGSVL